mmetsp:Transcript_58212/g.175989  ORF Transcript_58212/g.175989 Transcript_58212/m.175989 type:complete len:236 (+) Transcript_58212:181-888(+)
MLSSPSTVADSSSVPNAQEARRAPADCRAAFACVASQARSRQSSSGGGNLGEHAKGHNAADIGQLDGHGCGEAHLLHVKAGSAVGDVLHQVVPAGVDLRSPEVQGVDERGHAGALLRDLGGLEEKPRTHHGQGEDCDHDPRMHPRFVLVEDNRRDAYQHRHEQRSLQDQEAQLHSPGGPSEHSLQDVPVAHAVFEGWLLDKAEAEGVHHHRQETDYVEQGVGQHGEEAGGEGKAY